MLLPCQFRSIKTETKFSLPINIFWDFRFLQTLEHFLRLNNVKPEVETVESLCWCLIQNLSTQVLVPLLLFTISWLSITNFYFFTVSIWTFICFNCWDLHTFMNLFWMYFLALIILNKKLCEIRCCLRLLLKLFESGNLTLQMS